MQSKEASLMDRAGRIERYLKHIAGTQDILIKEHERICQEIIEVRRTNG